MKRQPADGSGGRRYGLLDNLRGLAVLNMVIYHGIYDWVYIFGRPAVWFTATRNAYLWEQAICWTFILVAGAVFPLGRRPARRGALVLGCGLVLTAVTVLVMPSEQILFGILHFLGIAMLLSALLKQWLLKVPAAAGAAGSFALFLLTKCLPRGGLGVGDVLLWPLPEVLYSCRWTFPLGLMGPGFYSADYFPLLPWMFLFWTGMYAWRGLAARWGGRLPHCGQVPGLAWLGRHSLPVYMLHQPVLLAAIWLLAHMVS